ncbi:MAG: hypothetical protein ACRESZ_15005 [Methylococcales bacterium]
MRIYSPVQIMLISTVVYLVILLTSPVSVANVASIGSANTLVGFFVCLTSGLLIGSRRVRSLIVSIPIDLERVDRLKWGLVAIGGLGMGLRIIERVYFRMGGTVTTDFMVNRDLVTQSGSMPLAMLAALLAPLLYFLPISVFMLRGSGIRRRSDYLFLWASSAYGFFDGMFFGSRSAALILVAIMVVAYLTMGAPRIRVRTIIFWIVGLIAFIWLSGQIFWTRTSQMGIDPIESLSLSAPAYMVTLDHSVLATIGSASNDGYAGLLYGYSTTSQYLLLGLPEFLNLVDNFTGDHTYGMQLFYVPAKILWVVTRQPGTIEDFMYKHMLRIGVYTTFFGPVFYDYGVSGGLLACLILGFLGGHLTRRLRKGSVHLIIPYVVITAFLPFTVVVNLFVTGVGQCLMIDAFVLLVAINRRRFRLNA